MRGITVTVALALAACGGPAAPDATPAHPRNPARLMRGAPYLPRIDPADFVAGIDNPYLPLEPGTTRIYEGTGEGEHERNEVFVTHRTKVVMGVTTTIVRDRVYRGGELIEETFDWFAQDRVGNVWYFGEASRDYEGGRVVSSRGSWEAGVDGAQPGVVMLAFPEPGDAYRQEYYRGEAEDEAAVVRLDATVTVPSGSFDDVLVTDDGTPLEPTVLERKFYARGVGLVMERKVRGGTGVLRLVEIRRP